MNSTSALTLLGSGTCNNYNQDCYISDISHHIMVTRRSECATKLQRETLATSLLFAASEQLGACIHTARTPSKKKRKENARSTYIFSDRGPLCRVFSIKHSSVNKPEKPQSLSLSRPLIKRRDFSPLSLLATAQLRAGMERTPICSLGFDKNGLGFRGFRV